MTNKQVVQVINVTPTSILEGLVPSIKITSDVLDFDNIESMSQRQGMSVGAGSFGDVVIFSEPYVKITMTSGNKHLCVGTIEDFTG